MIYQRENGVQGTIQLGDEWCVKVCDGLFDEITALFGSDAIQYVYDEGDVRSGLTFQAPPPRFNYRRREPGKPQATV